MNVIVWGTGIVGTTAAFLANGGQISVSPAEPWAHPVAPLKVFQPRLVTAQWFRKPVIRH